MFDDDNGFDSDYGDEIIGSDTDDPVPGDEDEPLPGDGSQDTFEEEDFIPGVPDDTDATPPGWWVDTDGTIYDDYGNVLWESYQDPTFNDWSDLFTFIDRRLYTIYKERLTENNHLQSLDYDINELRTDLSALSIQIEELSELTNTLITTTTYIIALIVIIIVYKLFSSIIGLINQA